MVMLHGPSMVTNSCAQPMQWLLITVPLACTLCGKVHTYSVNVCVSMFLGSRRWCIGFISEQRQLH